MKKIIILLASLLLISCGTTSNLSEPQNSAKENLQNEKPLKNSIKINLHDCCPELTESLKIEMALKATENNYSGIMKAEVNEDNFEKLKEYAAICKMIAQAVQADVFWTSSLNDKSNIKLNLNGEKNIKESINLIRLNSITDIYAVYTLSE